MPQSANFAFRAAYYNWPHPHRCSHTCVNASTPPPYLSPAPLPQGWLGRSDHPLYEGHAVQLVRWSDALVAWASEKAVTVSGCGWCLRVWGWGGRRGASEKAVTVSGAVSGACVGGRTHLQIQMLIQILSLSCIVTFRCMTPTLTSRSGPSAGTRPSPAARSAPAAAANYQLLCQQRQQREPDCLPRHLRDVFRCCLVTTAASSSAGRTVSRWGGKGLGWK